MSHPDMLALPQLRRIDAKEIHAEVHEKVVSTFLLQRSDFGIFFCQYEVKSISADNLVAFGQHWHSVDPSTEKQWQIFVAHEVLCQVSPKKNID